MLDLLPRAFSEYNASQWSDQLSRVVTLNSKGPHGPYPRLSSTLDYAAAFPRAHTSVSTNPRRINPYYVGRFLLTKKVYKQY